MSKIKLVLPKVERCSATISLPMSSRNILEHFTIQNAESYFEEKMNNSKDEEVRREFEKAKALVKYAECFSAELIKAEEFEEKVEFTFSFKSASLLFEFMQNMVTCIPSIPS